MPPLSVKQIRNGQPLDLTRDALGILALKRIHEAAASVLYEAIPRIPKDAHPAVAEALLENYRERSLIMQGLVLLHEIGCLIEPGLRMRTPEEVAALFSADEATAAFYAVGFKARPDTGQGVESSPPAIGAGI